MRCTTADGFVLRAFYKRMLRFDPINVRDYFGNVDEWRRLSTRPVRSNPTAASNGPLLRGGWLLLHDDTGGVRGHRVAGEFYLRDAVPTAADRLLLRQRRHVR